MDPRPTNDDGLLGELAATVPLADPAVVAVLRELTAEIERLRTADAPAGQPSVDTLTELLLAQAAELQETRDRLHRVRALIELSSWAADTEDGPVDPRIRASDLRHALDGPA